jgi:hypothetical protein
MYAMQFDNRGGKQTIYQGTGNTDHVVADLRKARPFDSIREAEGFRATAMMDRRNSKSKVARFRDATIVEMTI